MKTFSSKINFIFLFLISFVTVYTQTCNDDIIKVIDNIDSRNNSVKTKSVLVRNQNKQFIDIVISQVGKDYLATFELTSLTNNIINKEDEVILIFNDTIKLVLENDYGTNSNSTTGVIVAGDSTYLIDPLKAITQNARHYVIDRKYQIKLLKLFRDSNLTFVRIYRSGSFIDFKLLSSE